MENYTSEGRNDSLDLLLVANKRKPNFTEGESLYLISQFERNAVVLTSKLNDASTNKQKVEVWKRICNDYNSKNPVVLRTANDLKRKWKNMVRAAKKELLETTMTSPDGGESVSQRKLSPVSQRIVEILRISATNCGTLMTSFDGSCFAEDYQGEQALEQVKEEDSENNHHQENSPQQVIHVVVTRPEDIKPSVVVSPDINTDQNQDCEQSMNKKSDLSLTAASASNTEDHTPTHAADETVPSNSSIVSTKSNATVSAVPTPRQLPSSIRSANLTSSQVTGMRTFRSLSPQQKRMLPSSLAHVIKKRKLSDYGSQDESLSNVRAEVDKLKKEKLILEKEKLALEKEKLAMEKEKLALEIRFLRDQLD